MVNNPGQRRQLDGNVPIGSRTTSTLVVGEGSWYLDKSRRNPSDILLGERTASHFIVGEKSPAASSGKSLSDGIVTVVICAFVSFLISVLLTEEGIYQTTISKLSFVGRLG